MSDGMDISSKVLVCWFERLGMPADGRPKLLGRVLRWLVACVFIAMSGCGEEVSTSASDSWHIDQDIGEAMVYGLYDVDVEVIRDGCEPSLNVVTRPDDWPPPYTLVFAEVSRVDLDYYMLRQGRVVYDGGGWLDSRKRPLTPTIDTGTFQHPFYECEVPDSLLSNYRTTIDITAPATGVIKVNVNSHWPDQDDCPLPPESELRTSWVQPAWYPRSECRETYQLTYRLRDRCDREGPFSGPQYTTVTGDGYDYRTIVSPTPENYCGGGADDAVSE